jgi:hypothetical protein
MMDALGFREIWKRPDVKDDSAVIIDQLRALKNSASEFFDSQFGRFEVREELERNPRNLLSKVERGFSIGYDRVGRSGRQRLRRRADIPTGVAGKITRCAARGQICKFLDGESCSVACPTRPPSPRPRPAVPCSAPWSTPVCSATPSPSGGPHPRPSHARAAWSPRSARRGGGRRDHLRCPEIRR